jgi:Flp pilus assembly protein TadG
MTRAFSPQPRRHGIAIVEFAVVMAFLIPLLLFGLWEVGRLVEVSQVLNNAAREGARQAATGQPDKSQVTAVIMQYLQNEGLPTTHANVTIDNLGKPQQAKGTTAGGNYNPQNAKELDCLEVTVTVPFHDVEWVNIPVVTGPTTLVGGHAIWASVKDRAFPAPLPPPGF